VVRIALAPVPSKTTSGRLSRGTGRSPVRVQHDLHASGLLHLERLASLAQSLPTSSVEHNLGALPDVLPGGVAPQKDLSPAEMVRTIESNGCWMVLKNIEQDPEYAALLAACVDTAERLLTPDEGRTVLREGFVFLSAPGSMTPTHIDPEHNILLQLQGRKTMMIGSFESDTDLHLKAEELHGGEHRNLTSPAHDLVSFELAPGDGVYVPVHAPHLVRNGEQTSISLSITWRTGATRRVARIYAHNAGVRRRGGTPIPPGQSFYRDTVASGLRVANALQRPVRRMRSSRGDSS